ncbi:MAG: HAMP domain-containing protein [Desulfarculaceae bacterium]|nr:HAMP domain-containing protein [Desulfarculaceae bacterium]MCF8047281.1 HAMP domain-containing protein [Desulfarculaceae bacterium]MCF8066127.1 HAMP domain-containing protein [Desulfarculaceae bacterium]MCF8097416.1 HAMP domain-containing protein [Desulfarculaceae bacterium]MCF8123300.1 HAMP domain-containing protein [Desulfarculaceae bacterium]
MAFGLTSLRQRLMVLLLLPVALLLLGLGAAGFYYARGSLLDQWSNSAVLSLARAAHGVDMRLEQPEGAVKLINNMSGLAPSSAQEWQDQLAKLPGVTRVKLTLANPGDMLLRPTGQDGAPGMGMGRGRGFRAGDPVASGAARGMGFMRFYRVEVAKVTSPRLDAAVGAETVTLTFDLSDEEKRPVARLEVVMRFAHLLEDLRALNWWQSDDVYLVDNTGRVLARGAEAIPLGGRLGGSGDAFQVKLLTEVLAKTSGTILGPGVPVKEVAGFYHLSRAPWSLVMIARGDAVLAPVQHFLRAYVVAGLVCIGLVLLLIFMVTGQVAASVRQVCQAARQVAMGHYQDVPVPRRNDEFLRLAHSFNTMVTGLKEKDYIRDTFGRYVDPAVARRLMARPEATLLGGEKRKVAIMMTDVRGFTALCDTLSPEQTIVVVNRYLSRVIEVIQRHDGIIVDFLGDAVLAFFDSLDDGEAEAVRLSVCCALELLEATEEFNREAAEKGHPQLATGIGLNFGEVVVGNIGSPARTKYGIVGGPVNLTQRIQAQAEGGEIVISQEVHDLLPDQIKVGRSFSVRPKGLDRDIELYALTGSSSCAGPQADLGAHVNG